MADAWRAALLASGILLSAGCGGGPEQSTELAPPPAGADDAGQTGGPGTSAVRRTFADDSEVEPDTPLKGLPTPSLSPAPASADADNLQLAFDRLFRPELPTTEWDRNQQSILEAGALALPLLARELESSDTARREQASSLLAQSGLLSEPAEALLTQALQDASPFVRANAAAALAQTPVHREAAKQVLIQLLDSRETPLRRMAATNLALLGKSAADLVPQLTLALDDADDQVLRPIVRLLGEIGPAARPALPKLQQVAGRDRGRVRDDVRQAVLRIEGTPDDEPR